MNFSLIILESRQLFNIKNCFFSMDLTAIIIFLWISYKISIFYFKKDKENLIITLLRLNVMKD